jgi:hypothetical protein
MSVSSIESEFSALTGRKHQRTLSQKAAMIHIAPELPAIRCTVIDISVSGAGLWVGSTFGVPGTFKLAIEGDSAWRVCKVAWVQPHKLGVEFQ